MSEYDINELVRLSGISRRTIHFYVQQGILPAAQGAGLGARYGAEHLLRLRVLPLLRHQGMRLDEIRRFFAAHGPEDLQDLLQRQPVPAKPQADAPAPTSLQRYILAPGVELLVGASLSGGMRKKVLALLQTAQELFQAAEN